MKKYLTSILLAVIITFQPAFAKDYSVKKLPSGQTLIIKESHDNPIVTIDTWVKTGSVNETDSNNGVAHFLEHMFFKGTQKYPTGQFDRILESKGAITNAATSRDYTHYYIEIPSKYFELALELHSDMLLNPILPRNELEMERKVVLEEMARGKDNPDNILFKNVNENLYSHHPYKREVIGKSDIIENITREEMLNFYNTWYKPNNMITVIAGDINTNKAVKIIEKYFKSNEKTKTSKSNYPKDRIKKNIPPSVKNIDSQTGYLLIGFRGVTPNERKESAALDVLATILGNGKSSRLYQNIQEEKHLTNSIYSGHSSYKDDSTVFIKAKFNPENQQKVESEIWAEIDNIKNHPVCEAELKKAKNIIKRDTLYSRESNSSIANEFGYITALTGKTSYYDNYLKDIEKVKIKDIYDAANRFLDRHKAAVSYVMPNNTQIKPVIPIKENKNYCKSEKEYSNLGKKIYPYNGGAKFISQNINTKKYKLENGLILIINNHKSNDIIAINMLSKGGYFQESEIKSGVGNILSDMIFKGTNKYSAEDISTILDENGIEISSLITPDAFSTSIKTTKYELPIALNLFDELINDSILKEEDLKNVKEKKLQNIKTSNDIPSNLAFDEMKELLWENTPYHHSNKFLKKIIEKVTIDDVKSYYNMIYNPENTIISVNGNIDEQYLINYFSEVFKNKNSKIYNLNDYQKAVYPMVKDKFVEINKGSNQSWIVIAYRTPPVSNQKDWATLRVIDSILGTGMSSRLFTELRDQKGLAYTVSSVYQTNILQGAFVTFIGTNPKNIQQAKQGLEEQIDKLKKEFVSSHELSEAKDRIYGNYLLAQETNADKASTSASFELSGRGYDFDKKYFELINSVTEQDIIETANKYFSNTRVIVIVK